MCPIYDQPRLYAAAFSFRDIPKEVDVVEECIRRFSKVPVGTVLELACGHGPHSQEFAARGYHYIGVDSNPAMLTYLRNCARGSDHIIAQAGDMCLFHLGMPAHFAFVALGSLYARSSTDIQQHFASVANALPPGGLYLMDWCVYFSSLQSMHESWDTAQGDLHLHVEVTGTIIDPVEQILQERIIIEGTDDGKPVMLSSTDLKRIMYPQEFLLLIQNTTCFEFVGWWNDWDLNDPLPTRRPINRPIALLRRK